MAMKSIRFSSRVFESLHDPHPAVCRVAAMATGALLLVAATAVAAQIVSPGGPQSQDNGTSNMAIQPDLAASTVQESHKPQANEAKGNARGPTAGKDAKPEGAGGFSNGLYGTGAGSNK